MGSHASSKGRIHKKSGEEKENGSFVSNRNCMGKKRAFEKERNGQISHPFVSFKAKSSIGAV